MENGYKAKLNFGIAWEWKYDDIFIRKLDRELINNGLSCYIINPGNVSETVELLKKGMTFDYYLDRASDVDDRFSPIEPIVESRGGKIFNKNSYALRASDKATMHLEFLEANLNVPYTFLLPPFDGYRELNLSGIERLNIPFIIKPSSFGGGEGVQTARTVDDIQRARSEYPKEKYLVQEKVEPLCIEGKRAWFRPIYACDETYISWWDDKTHIYEILGDDDEKRFNLGEIREIVNKIARVSMLDLFSTEICYSEGGKFVVVDYVNDPCDLRIKSLYYEGVPDEIIDNIIKRIVDTVRKGCLSRNPTDLHV
ncbi:MAG: hypothetical protein PHO00_06600 [bacterium]|nr:hypothetical protein [bacterium]